MFIIEVVRAAAGFSLVFFIPGFIASWAFFPRMREISVVERAAFSMVLSLFFSIVPIMLLNYWPGIPVTGLNSLIIILSVTLLLALTAILRVSYLQEPDDLNQDESAKKT